MDCSICTSMPVILRPPRNTICGACYEGARSIINLINKLESEKARNGPPNSCKTLLDVSRWVCDMKDMENVQKEEVSFLKGGFFTALKDQMHTDMELKPGNNGPSIPAHRALLATRSQIFKNMLESDVCKAPPKDNIITLSELNHEELESFLQFLYTGSLPEEKMEKHVYSLSLAADKYEIPYLLKFCERHMLRSLKSSNALNVLEISDVCSYLSLKETALKFIVKNIEDIAFSDRFDEFALKNPHLCVQITRASLMEARKN
ncbi:BTB/POZ domain-containing protein At3g56230 isoform X1 [Castanea sativa]|uniref:BTB/POZ domain-containing protein At3g56230 isoform X1 n=1 Tax=Castanea sativa TaxID=21020 RepID=UPI003F6493EB